MTCNTEAQPGQYKYKTGLMLLLTNLILRLSHNRKETTHWNPSYFNIILAMIGPYIDLPEANHCHERNEICLMPEETSLSLIQMFRVQVLSHYILVY